MDKLSRLQLSLLLDDRNADPQRSSEIDREIWEQCGVDRGVLVLDLSGFTRITRQRGILHFLAVFRRAFKLFAPLVQANNGRLIKEEADNIIASFVSVGDALAAAQQMVLAAASSNVGLDEDDQVRPCIAVGYGHILELTDDFFGDEVNVTFKLGEDVARAGEVLITESAYQRLREVGKAPVALVREIEIGRVAVRYYSFQP